MLENHCQKQGVSRPVSNVSGEPRHGWPGQATLSPLPKGSLLGVALYSLLHTDPGVAPAWTLLTLVPVWLSGAPSYVHLCPSSQLLGVRCAGGLSCSAPPPISCPPCLLSGQCARPAASQDSGSVVFLGSLEPKPPVWALERGSFIPMSGHHNPTDREATHPLCVHCASVSPPVT